MHARHVGANFHVLPMSRLTVTLGEKPACQIQSCLFRAYQGLQILPADSHHGRSDAVQVVAWLRDV
jgi:hypothetical protein